MLMLHPSARAKPFGVMTRRRMPTHRPILNGGSPQCRSVDQE